MRRFLLALTVCALCLPAGAEAARRDERAPQPASRITLQAPKAPAAQAQRPAAQPRRSAAPSNRPAARPVAAVRPRGAVQAGRSAARPGDVQVSRGGVVVRGASAATVSREAASACTRRNGRTVCPRRNSVAGWHAGLPRTAENAQRECPAGTLATLARGHDDVVRCLPL